MEEASSRLLLWASRYPVLSQASRLAASGLRYPGDLTNLAQVREVVATFAGPTLLLHGHLHTWTVDHTGRALQIGVPTVVEWPHAWADASITLDDAAVRVEVTMRPVSGTWSRPGIDTVPDAPFQAWTFRDDWIRAGDAVRPT